MSEWIIGKVEIPKAPNKITNKFTKVIKKVPVLTESPWLFSQGADTYILSLEGSIFEGSKSLSTLHASYVQPIKDYISQGMVIPEVLLDESVTGWVSSGLYVFKSHSTSIIKGDYSIETRFSNGNGSFSKYFSSPRDYSKHNFLSLWQRGHGTDKFKISFYSTSGDRTQGYRYYTEMSSSNWKHDFASLSGNEYSNYISATTGTPSWKSISVIEVTPSGFNPSSSNVYYLWDRMAMGVGFKIKTPNDTYNGIYMIKDFITNEQGGDIESYKFKTNLLDSGDYYGTGEQ